MEVITPDPKAARRGIRRQQSRRLVTGLNVCVATVLALFLLVMLNYLAYRHYWRWDISQRDYYALSPKTQSLVGSLPGKVEVVMCFRSSHPLYEDMKNLMEEFRYEAEQHDPVNLSVSLVDPDRDGSALWLANPWRSVSSAPAGEEEIIFRSRNTYEIQIYKPNYGSRFVLDLQLPVGASLLGYWDGPSISSPYNQGEGIESSPSTYYGGYIAYGARFPQESVNFFRTYVLTPSP